jgi:hypothetical protein
MRATCGGLALVGLAAACGLRPEPTLAKEHKAMEIYHLRLGLSDGKLRAGHPVTVLVGLRNKTSSKAEFATVSTLFDYTYELTHQDGREVALTTFGQRGVAAAGVGGGGALRSLAPEEEYTVEVPLNRIFDLSVPGRYTLRVSRTIKSPLRDEWLTIKSAPLSFELGD